MDVEVFPSLLEDVPNNLSLGLVPGPQIEEEATGIARVEREDYTIPGQIRESGFANLRPDLQYRAGVVVVNLCRSSKPERGADGKRNSAISTQGCSV